MSQQQDCKSTIERAFEIAGSGSVITMNSLGRLLADEGYALNMLTGPLLMKQLRGKMMAAQGLGRPSGELPGDVLPRG